MEIATVHVLTALYALAHRLALAPEDAAEVERHGAGLSPELWRQSKGLFREADHHGAGSHLDLGFTALLLLWLDVPDEDAFAKAFGVRLDEALDRDRGSLGVVAHVIESRSAPGPEELSYLVTLAWCRRAGRLMASLPETARAAIEALEHALDHCPSSGGFRRQLLECLGAASAACGDEEREAHARERIEALDREDEARNVEEAVHVVTARIVSILWCLAHDDCLLEAERGLDPGIERSPGVWAAVRRAVEAGRVEDLPVPVATFEAWSRGAGLAGATLRACLEQSAAAGLLPDMVRAVGRVWGGEEPCELAPSPGAYHVIDAAFVRRRALECDWHQLPGEAPNIWYAAHQSARKPETLVRVALIRHMHGVLHRCGDLDPLAAASVYLDRAAECEARGAHEEERSALAHAVLFIDRVDGRPEYRGYGEVCLATACWRAGDIARALAMLEGIEGPTAREALAKIAAKEPEREALRCAELAFEREGDLGSGCRLPWAHHAAGHTARAHQVGSEMCGLFPEEAAAWTTLAGVLYEQGRYRDALEPARTALEKAQDGPGRVLLARILNAVGPEGREESRALAVAGIEGHPDREVLGASDLAQLARIAHDGGADLSLCRRADDHVWSRRDTEALPDESIGAAVARRCDGVWAPDAPGWLARLAEAADEQPLEIARFIVERVDSLVYYRELAHRALYLLDPSEELDAGRPLGSRARAYLKDRYGYDAQSEAALAAGRAAVSLGYGGPVTGEVVEPAVHWEPHVGAIKAAFGVDGAVRLSCERARPGRLLRPGRGGSSGNRPAHLGSGRRADWVGRVGGLARRAPGRRRGPRGRAAHRHPRSDGEPVRAGEPERRRNPRGHLAYAMARDGAAVSTGEAACQSGRLAMTFFHLQSDRAGADQRADHDAFGPERGPVVARSGRDVFAIADQSSAQS